MTTQAKSSDSIRSPTLSSVVLDGDARGVARSVRGRSSPAIGWCPSRTTVSTACGSERPAERPPAMSVRVSASWALKAAWRLACLRLSHHHGSDEPREEEDDHERAAHEDETRRMRRPARWLRGAAATRPASSERPGARRAAWRGGPRSRPADHRPASPTAASLRLPWALAWLRRPLAPLRGATALREVVAQPLVAERSLATATEREGEDARETEAEGERADQEAAAADERLAGLDDLEQSAEPSPSWPGRRRRSR